MRTLDRRGLIRLVGVATPSLVAATLLVWVLQDLLGVPNASAVYLVAVVATAIGSGTRGALACAAAGILLYDYLFTLPLHTFVVGDAGVWLNLVLLLFVALVVGELTGLQRERAEQAGAREREARDLFAISRALATRPATQAVLPEIARVLRATSGIERIAVALGPDDARERVIATSPLPTAPGSAAGQPEPDGARRGWIGATHMVLQRMPGDEPARWVRIHPPGVGRARSPASAVLPHRVRIEVGDVVLGSIWAEQPRSRGPLDRTATRLMSAAADQIGQALLQDRLAAEARHAEVSRASDALKSALLQSVSHDLRTPLAAIRAAAGTLRPGSGVGEVDRRASAAAIEAEVLRLDRLVANLLDLSRIEAGALRPQPEVFELDDLVGPIIDRLRPSLGDRRLQVVLSSTPILADPVLLDEVVTNLLENAVKFTPPGTVVRVAQSEDPADAGEPGYVRLTVEDGGPGVPPASRERIFEKFYQEPGRGRGSRPGTGIGLAVVRGLAEAMGARVVARESDLGGLAIDVDLPIAQLPPDLEPPPAESGAMAATIETARVAATARTAPTASLP